MYCPQCGTESGTGQPYCRSCGANLKVIGKALTLSEAIARSDRGPLPRIKEMVKNLKVERVTEEVSRALDRVNTEIVRSSESISAKSRGPWWRQRRKTAEERREDHIVKGTVSVFSGLGLTIFLYYFTAGLVLKLPPLWIDQVPFEIEPVIHVLWLLGLVPMLSGAGHILAGLLIRPTRSANVVSANIDSRIDTTPQALFPSSPSQPGVAANSLAQGVPSSVTEHTTNLLERPD
jgi:hypothetical protein